MIARRSLLRTLVSLCAVVGGLLFVWSAPALAQRMHEFSKSFGGEGSGTGQLSRPGQLAVNEATGDVYVIDRGNARVEIFSSAGAYVGQFNGSASPTGAFSWIAGFGLGAEPEGAIAIDNSTNPRDPSRGDVYVADDGHRVIDKFTASGAYIGQITGTSPTSLFGREELQGIAVDPDGALWRQDGSAEGVIDQFNDASANEYVSTVTPRIPNEGTLTGVLGIAGLAFDSEENLYIGLLPNFGEKLTVPMEFSKTGEALVERLDGEETTGLAVDLSSDDVYVDHEASVAAYGPSHSSIERFGSGQMQASEGIAVDSATGTVYTSDASKQEIDMFKSFVVPDVTTGGVSSMAETSVTVGGVVNPDGLPVTSCVFEYGTSTAYGQSEPCSPNPGSGGGPLMVTGQLKGLKRLTKYHFRLSVSNANGSNRGQDHTFVTPESVSLSEEAVSDISSTSALFSVQVDPGGADTTYHFEYGPSVSYGESVPVPAGDLGSGTSSETAAVRAQDLLAQTTYHARIVASNLLGTVYGPDETFTTQTAGGAFLLPDGREWEMVSPPSKNGALIEPTGGEEGGALAGSQGLTEASVDGGVFGYYATGPVGDDVKGNPTPFGLTEVLSRRGASGWFSEDVTTPNESAGEGLQSEYAFFSADLSLALVEPSGAALFSAEATEETPYVRDDDSGSYLPLVTASNVPPETKFGPPRDESADPKVAAVTPDLSHAIILSQALLTSNSVEPAGKNIYEWSAGRLQLVNELPNHTVSAGADFGSNYGYDTRGALSRDGSRVFFGVGSAGQGDEDLYMRDTVTDQTVRVDTPAPGVPPPPDNNRASFQIASADGSKVFFLDEEPLTLDSKLKPVAPSEGGPSELYVYDVAAGSLTDLSVDQNAGEQANVQDAVVGASEAGSVVYFVATGKLAEGAVSGQDNLYVESEAGSSWSSPRLVAVLSEEDGSDWGAGDAAGTHNMYLYTSMVSASGRYLAFMSDRSLTGYDNRDAVSGQPDEEVFLYDEATSGLRCVSCNSTGARPEGIFDQAEEQRLLVDRHGVWKDRWLAASIPGWTEPKDEVGYQPRVLSDEGRMFFDSADALVPQDTNDREDVYEYEPRGVGGCASPAGCVSLISSGTSAEESTFLDASGRGPGGEEGEDVFFLTAARLSPQDVDTSFDVYDAHVCSTALPCVSVPASPPPCTSGDSCKAAPSPQPAIFGAPSSATFSGAGNITPPPPVSAAEPKSGSKSAKCKSRFVKKGRCVKKPKPRKRKVKAAKSSRGGKK